MAYIPDEAHLHDLIWRVFPKREAVPRQIRSDFCLCSERYDAPQNLELPEFLNGYQLAYSVYNQVAARLAHKNLLGWLFRLKLTWPRLRQAEDFELFLEGLAAASEQGGFLSGEVTGKLGESLALELEVQALQEVGEMPKPTAQPGDVLFLLHSPGEAAAGCRVLQEAHSGDATLAQSASGEQLIAAYLRPSLQTAAQRIMRRAGFSASAYTMQQGLLGAVKRVLSDAPLCGVELSDELRGSPPLSQAAENYGLDPKHWVYWGKDYQLLWQLAAANYATVRSLIWNQLEIETIAVGRLGPLPGIWIKDFFGRRQLAVQEL